MTDKTKKYYYKNKFLNANILQPTELLDNATKLMQIVYQLISQITEMYASSDSTTRRYNIYTGSGGIAWMFLRLYHVHTSSAIGLSEELLKYDKRPIKKNKGSNKPNIFQKNAHQIMNKDTFLDYCLEWAEKYILCSKKRMKKNKTHRHSFLCGSPGIYSMECVLYHLRAERSVDHDSNGELYEELESKLMEQAPEMKDADASNELLYGRVGYLYALLFVTKYCPDLKDNLQPKISALFDTIIMHGEFYSKKNGFHNETPLMYEWHGRTYFGAAHGLSGIIYVLLHVRYKWDSDDDEAKRIWKKLKKTIDYLKSKVLPSGNYPTRSDSVKDKLVQWCHGSPAFGLLFARVYEITRESQYLEAAKAASDHIWKTGLLKKGVGLCHGTSGNGYLFLWLYRLTNDVQYLSRCWRFIEFSLETDFWNVPDQPYSLFNGSAGAICFYLDTIILTSHACKNSTTYNTTTSTTLTTYTTTTITTAITDTTTTTTTDTTTTTIAYATTTTTTTTTFSAKIDYRIPYPQFPCYDL